MGSLLGGGTKVEVEETEGGVEYMELEELEEFALERGGGEGMGAGWVG